MYLAQYLTKIISFINMTAKKDKKKKRCYLKEEHSDPNVVAQRKGGGTLTESPAVFSDDGKYLYVNSGWGARIFSVKTGECVRVLELPRQDERVVSVFTISSQPYALTANYSLIKWDPKSGKILKDVKLASIVLKDSTCLGGIQCSLNPEITEEAICVKFDKSGVVKLGFFSIESGLYFRHPWNNAEVQKGEHVVSFGGSGQRRIMVCINSEILTVYESSKPERSPPIHAGVDNTWTCVQCHPTEETVVAGDYLGRVVLMKDPFNHSFAKTIFHWHTLPVRTIAFSPAGSTMYSGGGEHTLVKWNTDNPNVRNYLPRLSAPILHITLSSDNNLLAVSTADNGIVLVDSKNKLKCVLQQMAWGALTNSGTQLLPAGLEYDARAKAFILNSRPGHLQFYQPETETFLFGMDVTQLNYLTQERDKVIVNTEVFKTCISSDCAWLATVEMRNEPACSLELKLKFWLYDVLQQKFTLNTVIDLPHNGEITCLKFGPGRNKLYMAETPDTRYLAVTAGKDGKFRFWTPQEVDSVHKKGVSWNCQAVGSYKQKPCSYASFCQDGSLVAVAFEQSLTIWFVGALAHRATLSKNNGLISQVEFGRDTSAHLVVVCTEKEVMVWNLITLSLLWSAEVTPTLLVVDPASTYMALFSAKKKVYIFNPATPVPVYTCRRVCYGYTKLLSAKFVPRETSCPPDKPNWLQKSILYYLESNQELKSIDCKFDESQQSIDIVEDEEKGTAFTNLIAEQMSRDEKKSDLSDGKPLHFGMLGRKAVHKVLMSPAHTMPPMSLLCSSILETFAHRKRNEAGERNEDENEKETPMEVASSDSETDIDEVKPLRGATVIHDVDLPIDVSPETMEKRELFVIDVDPLKSEEDLANFSFKDL